MGNTALSAGVKSTKGNTEVILFKSEEHRKFYNEKLSQVRYQDCYHKALIRASNEPSGYACISVWRLPRVQKILRFFAYTLGISEDTREHFSRIYDISSGMVKSECLHDGWQTSGSVKIVRMAFNLYTDGSPSVYDYENGDEQLNECRLYSVSDLFCCGYAMYFWQAIQLRYPEYCREQPTMEEILARLEAKRSVKS